MPTETQTNDLAAPILKGRGPRRMARDPGSPGPWPLVSLDWAK